MSIDALKDRLIHKDRKAQKRIRAFIDKEETEKAELQAELRKLRKKIKLIRHSKQFALFSTYY